MNAHDMLQKLIDEAPDESVPVPARDWVRDGALVRSRAKAGVTARIASLGDGWGLVFDWDNPRRNRLWSCGAGHIRKHYYPIG